MCILPMFSQKRAPEARIFEIDCWFRDFDPWPLSGILDKMVDMLKKSPEANDREAGDLIGRKLCKRKRESYKSA